MFLIDSLIKGGWLKTDTIINAFRKIKREDFLALHSLGEGGLPDDLKNLAELNEALPIGFGQTISQPLTVAFMLELLEPKKGDKILDIGSGSGWTTALLSEIVGNKGKVIAVEIVPELKEMGEKNVSKYNFINPVRGHGDSAEVQKNKTSNGVKNGIVEFILGDGSKGYQKEAPYDKILASATGSELSEAWKRQLKIGGRIVCPIDYSIWLFVKKDENNFESTEYPGFSFVPLILHENE